MKKTKQRAVNLGYGYVLDEELTLKKIMQSEKTGKTREVVKGYYANLETALKGFADNLIKDGIQDGAIKNVNHAIARLKAAYADLTGLKPSEIVTD